VAPSSPRLPESGHFRNPEKSRPSVFWPLAAIVIPLTGFFAKIEIIDGHKLPREGAFILAPSHSTEFDPLIVAVAVWRMGRAPRFMAKASLFKVPVLGWVLRAAGMVPVARSSSASATRQTVEDSKALVEHGRGVIVYPEGTLTRDPDLWPMRGLSGAVRLALADGIPLIPMAHWGGQKIMPRYGKLSFWPPRRPVKVIVGDPIDLSEFEGVTARTAALAAATDRLMNAIAQLLAQLRGEPAPEKRWNPAAHGQSETGRLEP